MNKNAKMLFLGRVSSSFGDSIYSVAVIWHVYYLTNNTFYTGLATAFTMLPKVFNFLFGPWVEYQNKHKILKFSQFIQFFLMLIIPISFYLGYENVWLLLLVIALISFIENIQGTSEISIVPQLMSNEEIPKYNSLISSFQQTIDLSMKGIFGFIILFISIESIYLFNAVTFLIAALFFTFINYQFEKKSSKPLDRKKYKADLLEGIKYMGTPSLLFILLPFFVSNFFAGIITTVLPAFAEYKVDLNAYSLFLLSSGIGSIIGSLLTYKLSKYPLNIIMTVFPFSGFIFILLSVFVDHGFLSIAFFGLANITIGLMSVYFISYVQTTVSVEMLSRVASVVDSFLVATIPIGGILAGILSRFLSASHLMLFNSLGMLFVSLYFLFVTVKGNKSTKSKSSAS
jgi:MFS family permease